MKKSRMKNYIIAFMFIILVFGTISSCKKGDCTGVTTYSTIDTRLSNYFFKVGSFWVYQDSASGLIDSQTVVGYTYALHQLDSTPTSGGGSPSHSYCGPFYFDILSMIVIDFKNGMTDSILCSSSGEGISIESLNPNSDLGEDIFNLNSADPGTRLLYLGSISTFFQNATNFNNVQVFQSQYSPLYSYYFTCNTDLYFCSGFGIIKKIEHTSGGDRVWQLKRFHLL
jgi:hypothetical protein